MLAGFWALLFAEGFAKSFAAPAPENFGELCSFVLDPSAKLRAGAVGRLGCRGGQNLKLFLKTQRPRARLFNLAGEKLIDLAQVRYVSNGVFQLRVASAGRAATQSRENVIVLSQKKKKGGKG